MSPMMDGSATSLYRMHEPIPGVVHRHRRRNLESAAMYFTAKDLRKLESAAMYFTAKNLDSISRALPQNKISSARSSPPVLPGRPVGAISYLVMSPCWCMSIWDKINVACEAASVSRIWLLQQRPRFWVGVGDVLLGLVFAAEQRRPPNFS